MNQPLSSPIPSDAVIPDSDEISLTDLFRNLWRQRGLILGILVFFIAAIIALQVGKGSVSAPLQVDYPIAMTFSKDLNYPNGSPFSPNDLTRALVLERVTAKQGLALSASDLAKVLGVSYSNSLLLSAEEKLGKVLQNTKTPEDIKAAASEALAQMKTEGQRFLTLSVNLNEAGLTPDQGVMLARNIVDEWALVSIEQGLLNVDISRPINAFMVPAGANLIDVYDLASGYLESLSNAVSGLSKQAGAESLIVNRKSLNDLRREIMTLDSTEIGPLREFAYSNSSSLASVDPGIQVRLFARQRLLRLEQERLSKLIASYDSALAQLMTVEGGDRQSGVVKSSEGNLQLEQSVIDSLLQMGTRLGAVENRNKLFDRRTKAVEDLLALEKEMAILMGLSDSAYDDLKPAEVLKMALPGIEQRLNSIQADVNAFFNAYRDISLQSGAQLYSAQSAPQVRGGAVIVAKQLIKYAALAAVLGLMLGVMVALVRAAMINSRR